jgi:hypothetical protein
VKELLKKTPNEKRPRLLASDSAARECSASVSKPQNWGQFSKPPALPPCCKAYALTPHPLTYAPYELLSGRRPTRLRTHRCQGLLMKTEQAKMQP